MATAEQIDNESVARLICERREFQGQRFQRGEFVALVQGRVIGTGKTFEEVDSLLLNAGIPHGEGMVIKVVEPITDIIR